MIAHLRDTRQRVFPPRSQLSSSRGEGLWLLSLGDLLTLLLGFFIALVSLSPANPAVRASNQEESSSNTNEVTGRVLDAPDGTAIASPEVGEPVALFEDDLDESRLGLGAVRLRTTIEAALSEGYADKALVVETCEPVQNGRRGGGWDASAARALTIRGQLIDAGLGARRVSTRLLGPSCGSLTPEGAQSTALARLSFETVGGDD